MELSRLVAGDRARAAAAMISAACAMALLAGCDKKPVGQVAAVVNGQEITMQEVNLALGQTDGSAEGNETARRAALQTVVNRKLAAEIAREEGIDRTPDYVLREQQMKESLILQLFAQKIGRSLKQPSPAQVSRFIADNPNMFADRILLNCDQVRFPATQDNDLIGQLRGAKTMADVITLLDAKGIRYERSSVAIDSATLPTNSLKAILALPAGEPFVMPGRGAMMASVVTGTRPIPLTGDQANPVALAALQRTMVNEELEKRVKAARAKAKIEYQTALGPTTGATAAKP